LKNFVYIIKYFLSSLFIFGLGLSIYSQPGVGPAPYGNVGYNNVPCNQPNASNNAANSINDFIQSFNTTGAVVNITNNNTGCNSQVIATTSGNYYFVGCPTFLRVNPGQVITCNFLSGIIFDQGFAVWIDWNKNNVFDIWSEQVCATAGVPLAATWASANFVVPAVAAGTYRMRVRCAYARSGSTILPYCIYSHGETEDYNLVVGAGVICPLPVQLVFYDALIQDKNIEIKWSTASEVNSDYFTLERSYDNQEFDLIHKTAAAGNSYEVNEYSFTDTDVKSNTVVYYRLKQFDKGKSEPEFTKTISVYSTNHQTGFEIYPNPVASNLKLLFPDKFIGQKVKVTVFDNMGTQILSSEMSLLSETPNYEINTSELKSGVYYLNLTDESGENFNKLFLKE